MLSTLDKTTREKLATQTHLTERQVYNWFIYQKTKINTPKTSAKLIQEKLRIFFQKNQRPTKNELRKLALETQKDEEFIKNWFKRERFNSKAK